MSLTIFLALLAAYVVGSVDFAVVVGRLHGVDIRQVGSGNPGTSNVLRTLGRLPAAMVFLGDMMKGVIGAAMGAVAASAEPMSVWAFLGGLSAVIGHCYPVFHRFRGGKGVATGAGVALFTMPIGALAVTAVWAAVVAVTRVASLGSLAVVVVAIPVALWQGVRGSALVVLAAILVVIVWRHRGNIRRMSKGGEQKVTS
ncbi:glycerol-3-phosphate 1-O-acyltransferase PlsY [soil metagenome]